MRCVNSPLTACLVGVLASLMAVGTSAAQRASEEREAHEVTKLVFRGVQHVDQDDLARSIHTQASGCRSILLKPICLFSHSSLFNEKHYLDETEFKRDVLRIKVFYWKRGYRQTQVDTSVARVPGHEDDVQVAFDITEGPPTLVRTLAVVRPESLLTARDLHRTLLLRAGQPLDLLNLDSSRVLLRDRMWDLGFADAVLADTIVVHDSAHVADVTITVDPRWKTTVGSIDVAGNDQIARSTINRMLTFHVGDPYRREDVLQSQRNLYASNLFRHAIILPPKGDSVKHLQITVAELPEREMTASAGFNTVDFVQTEGRFTNYNWLGGARRLDLDLVLSNLLAPALNGTGIFHDVTVDQHLTSSEATPFLRPNFQASVQITQPWFRDARNTLGLSFFARRQSAPGVFIDKGYGTSLSFTRDVEPRVPLSLVYRYEQTEVDAGDVYFCVNYGVCELSTIGLLRNRSALSPLSLDFFADRSNDPLLPTDGWQARLDLEHASRFTLSDFRYNRISGEATRYLPIGHAVLAGRVRFGWVKPIGGGSGLDSINALHPRKRFYAGGANSVRGYGENQLGPRVLTVDPAVLLSHGCTTAELSTGDCSAASIDSVPSRDFTPRPTGGTNLIEGNLEYRFPLRKKLWGAVFVDGAFVGEGALQQITQGTGAITPGFGARYQSPVGAIRVDLGIRPTLKEDLAVITEVVNPDSTRRIQRLKLTKAYDPVESSGAFHKVLSRLALHLSIGQPF